LLTPTLWPATIPLPVEEFVVIGWTDPEDARPWLGALPLANYFAPRRNLVGLYASGKRAHGGMPEPVPGFEAPIKYRRDS
jgi:hypothetical protein